jgi:hypothetical protein
VNLGARTGGGMSWISGPRLTLALLAMLALQAAMLAVMGQPAICACGTVRLWTGVVQGPENSQQIADWYTPSHLIHGILFFAAIRLLFPRLPFGPALLLALAVEIGWELIENSPPVIARYRQQALAQGYSGDSILNSVTDTLAAAAGFLFASRAPVWSSATVVVGLEVFTGVMIRDGLLLNIIQLIHPSAAISRWQTGSG